MGGKEGFKAYKFRKTWKISSKTIYFIKVLLNHFRGMYKLVLYTKSWELLALVWWGGEG